MKEDLLASMLRALNEKENPPQTDDNTLLTKNIIPSDSATMTDGGAAFNQYGPPSSFVWGGYLDRLDWRYLNPQSIYHSGALVSPGWVWGSGRYASGLERIFPVNPALSNLIYSGNNLTLPSVGAPTFSRASVAYDYLTGVQVASGVPRYDSAKFLQGVMIEEGTTNLLTANQSTPQSGTTGWTASGSYPPTLTQVTGGLFGTDCIQCAYPAGDSWGGFWGISYSPSTAYTMTIHVKGVSGNQIYLELYDGVNGVYTSPLTLNGSWQTLSATITTASNATTLALIVRSNNGTQTIYLDGMQVEQKTYSTSWTLGGATRAAETLTIPTAGVINKGNWTIEMEFIPTSNQVISGRYGALWTVYIDDNNFYYLGVNPLGQIFIQCTSGGNWYGIVASFAVSSGVSYAICATGNGSALNLCVNGTNIGTYAYSELVGILPSTMGVGCNWILGDQCNGIIDDLRFSNRARTLAEHQAYYNGGVAQVADGYTTCLMHFDNNMVVGQGGMATYPVIDLGPASITSVTASWMETVPANTSDVIQAQFSNNGTSWGAAQTITKGVNLTANLSRYCLITVLLATTNNANLPTAQLVEVDAQVA